MRKFFYCVSCQMDRPIEQLGKTVKINHSKRCTTCCANAKAQREALAKGAN